MAIDPSTLKYMKKRWFYFIHFAGLLSLLAGCHKPEANRTEEYLIQVDSIQCADTVQRSLPFEVSFYGRIGENGCYHFSRFFTTKSNGMVRIQVVGKKEIGQNLACPELLPLLNGEKLSLRADTTGQLRLEVMNPGLNQYIRKTVVVIP